MAGFKLLSVLCAFLLFQSTFAFFGKDSTKVKIGCYKFMGYVQCKDGSKILPSAKVELYEDDLLGDDLLVEHKLERSATGKSAIFSFRGCYNDGNLLFLGPKFAYMELYYKFKDVCHKGDSYTAKDVLQEKNAYFLHDDEAYLI